MLLIPCSVPLVILPKIISPLKGRKTIRRNFTSHGHQPPICHTLPLLGLLSPLPFTLTRPVPCPIRPSEESSKSQNPIHKPTFWITFFTNKKELLFSCCLLTRGGQSEKQKRVIKQDRANNHKGGPMYFVCIFFIDVILNRNGTELREIFRGYLNQIGNSSLSSRSDPTTMSKYKTERY